VTGLGIALVIEAMYPGFLDKRWKEIQHHWKRS